MADLDHFLPQPDCSYADHSYPAYSKRAVQAAIKAAYEAGCAVPAQASAPEVVTCPDCAGAGGGMISHPYDEDTWTDCGRCSGTGKLTAQDLPPFGYGAAPVPAQDKF